MMPKLLPQAAAVCLCWVATSIASPAQTPAPTNKPTSSNIGKIARTPHRASKPAMPVTGPAANLNAPSTDFSTVEAETGEPRERRQRGPNVRPGLDSNGRPVMGLGF